MQSNEAKAEKEIGRVDETKEGSPAPDGHESYEVKEKGNCTVPQNNFNRENYNRASTQFLVIAVYLYGCLYVEA